MIKTSMLFSINVIKVAIRSILLFFSIVLLTLFIWLHVGIHINGLGVGRYKVDGLYIKLDKKLTLKAERIEIPRSKSAPSFEKVDETFDTLKYLLTLFQYIELTNVTFSNNTFKVVFADNILYITSKDYEIAGMIKRKGQKYIAEVPMLYIKKEQADISGDFVFDAKSETLSTKGKFSAYGIKGRFKASKINGYIRFAINSEKFADIRLLASILPLKNIVKTWITDKIDAKGYRLYALIGRFNLSPNANPELDLHVLKGNLLVEKPEIHFHQGLSPVTAESFVMTYRQGELHFDFKNPRFETRDITGSRIEITELLGEKPTRLKMNLHIVSPMDETMVHVLKTYRLKIPVIQKKGEAVSDVSLDIEFNTGDTTALIDSTFKDALLYVNQAEFNIQKGKVKYEKGIVSLENIDIDNGWYKGEANGEITLEKETADLKFDAEYIKIGGEKKAFFELKKKMFNIHLDYSDTMTISIPELTMKMTNDSKKSVIKIENIAKIKPYIKKLGLQVNGGRFNVTTPDFETFALKGQLQRDSCFFYDKRDECHTKVPFSAKIAKENVHFYAFNKRLHFNVQKSLLSVQNINVDLEAFLASTQQFEKMNASKKKRNGLTIRGKKSNVRYRRHTLLTDDYDIKIKNNGNIKAVGKLGKDVVNLEKKGKNYSIKALRIQDRMLHPLIDFDGLKEGKYSFKIEGDPDKEMKGQILVEGGVMRDFKAYNNVLAFLNTLPAMVTFSSPGFSSKGFKIKKGTIDYRILGDKVIFDSIVIDGWSATIAGKGEVDIKKKTIQIDLAIRTARELGAVVGKIPLLGYILLGEDESITIGLKISGDLEDPKVETSTVEDILTTPLNLIKRTFESPGQLVKKDKKETKGGGGKRKVQKKRPSAYEQLGLEDPKKKEKATKSK